VSGLLRRIAPAERSRFDIYDALIVAAALVAGCRERYSEDMQHGQTIERLRVTKFFLGL
jgi:predicted nucleic acid-binding protein